jgi:hypothetical protein
MKHTLACAMALACASWTTHNSPTGPATVIGPVGSTHTFTAPPSFVVPQDPDGWMHRILPQVQQSIQRRERPVLQGLIQSGSTVWSGHPNVCAMPDTCLAFHAPLHPHTGQPWLGSPRENAAYLRAHPTALQTWIVQSGSQTDLTGRYHHLCTPDLWQYVRPCQ